MLLTAIFAVIGTIAFALAVPFQPNTTEVGLGRRATPKISGVFSQQEMQQIRDGHADAIELAQSVIIMSQKNSKLFDKILAKYFDPADSSTILGVFQKITGDDLISNQGHHILSDISVSHDFPDSASQLACKPGVLAGLRGTGSDRPTLIICPFGLTHGGIDKSYSGVQAVSCSTLGPRVSWKMDTLGSTILHEYTHFTKLVIPPMSQKIIDRAYCPSKVRALSKPEALTNADSYTWFANELFWTRKCGTDYRDPTDLDNERPGSPSRCKIQ